MSEQKLDYFTGDTNEISSSDTVKLFDKEMGIPVATCKRQRKRSGLQYTYSEVQPILGVEFKRYKAMTEDKE